MNRALWIQVIAIYWPIAMALALAIWIRPGRRERIGLLFACAWVAGVLPLLDGLIQIAGSWRYMDMPRHLGRMPLGLYFGWIGLWGLVAPLLALRFRLGVVLLVMTALDFMAMPQMLPLVVLSKAWWAGELVLLGGLLLPAMLLARWTATDVRVSWRAVLLAICFSLLALLVPALVIAGDLPALLAAWHHLPYWASRGLLGAGLFPGAMAWSAMRDLALDGRGTPVPLDPTRRLVTTGVYGYVANPMQLAMTTMLLLEAAVLHSAWIALFGAMTVLYSAGFARWSESIDMPARFGTSWRVYRANVRCWLPSLHLCQGYNCLLYVDLGCGKCSELAQWFVFRHPVRLEIRDASGLGYQRITWEDPESGRTEEGVMAVARALQHIHIGWAMFGMLLSLPGIAPAVQVCMDASGTAPAIKS